MNVVVILSFIGCDVDVIEVEADIVDDGKCVMSSPRARRDHEYDDVVLATNRSRRGGRVAVAAES
jgi:hypothetical protein